MNNKNKIEVDKSEIIEWIKTLHKYAMFIRMYSQKETDAIKKGDLHRPAVMILGVRKKLKKLINYFDQTDLDRDLFTRIKAEDLQKKEKL